MHQLQTVPLAYLADYNQHADKQLYLQNHTLYFHITVVFIIAKQRSNPKIKKAKDSEEMEMKTKDDRK